MKFQDTPGTHRNCLITSFLFSISYILCFAWFYQHIDLMGSVFTNGMGGQGSIPCQVIPKTQKMVLDISFINSAL